MQGPACGACGRGHASTTKQLASPIWHLLQLAKGHRKQERLQSRG